MAGRDRHSSVRRSKRGDVRGFIVDAGARVVRALFTLPRQMIAVTRRGRSVTWSDPGLVSKRETGGAQRVGRAMIGLLTAVGATAAALSSVERYLEAAGKEG